MRKLLNLLVFVFLLPILFFFSLTFVVNSTFFNERYYTDLIDTKFQDELSKGVTNLLYEVNDGGGFLEVASKDEFLIEIKEVLTVDILKSIVRDFLIQLNKIKEGKENKLVLSFEIFREILSDTLVNLFEKNYDKLPICELNDLRFVSGPCRIQGNVNSELVKKAFKNELQSIAVREWGDLVYEPNGVEGKWNLFSLLRFYDQVDFWVKYLVIVFLILLILINLKDLKSVISWFGILFLLNGFELLILYFVFSSIISQINLSENVQLVGLAEILQRFFLSGPLEKILMVGVIYFLSGLFLFVMKKKLSDEKKLNKSL